MNVLKPAKKLAVLSALVEGCSVRSVVRMTGVHKTTILKLLLVTGQQCQQLLDERMRGLQCQGVECDEIWSFIQKKQARVTKQELDRRSQVGDIFTFVAFDPDTKAVITFHVGKRDAIQTNHFIADLSRRVTNSF